MNETISFPVNRKLAVIKDSFKTYFHRMEKLLPIEGIFGKLEQNGFQYGLKQTEENFKGTL